LSLIEEHFKHKIKKYFMKKIGADSWLFNKDANLKVEDMTFGKNKVKGSKGQLLVELQKSYKGDSRFRLSGKFEEDIDVNKLPRRFKELQSDLV
jgi:hypothetical protein